jgi:glycosyltransferase involved in cell wall biosynthesis
VQFAVAAFGSRTPALLRLLRALRERELHVVATYHEVSRDTASLRGPGRALYRRLTALAGEVIVHTGAARECLAGFADGAAGAHLIPHPRVSPPAAGADADELRARHGLERRRILLAFGFIHVDKGLGDLVGALHALPVDTREDVTVVVAGEVRRRRGAFRAFEVRDHLHLRAVRRRVRHLGLEGAVAFTGYVDPGEIRPWFQAADVAVLPYRRIEQSGVANIAAELGTPVVASTAGDLASEIGAAWAAPPAAPDELAAAIAAALSTPRAQRPPARGADAASMAQIADRTLDVYGGAAPREPEGHAVAA